jgi:hypothetical protein
MLRRTLVGVILAAGLAAPVRAAEVDPLLPADTESVMFVNVRQMLDSDLFKKYAKGQLEQVLEGNDAQQLLKELGLNPMKDVDRVTVGSWGKGAEDMQAAIVIRGKFDPDKLFKAAQDQAKTKGDEIAIVEEGNYKLVKFTPKDQPKPIYASVADDKTIVAGTEKKIVTTALDAAAKGGKPTLKKELATLLLKQDEKASMFAVGLVSGKIDGLPPGLNIPGVDSAKLGKQLEKMENFALTLRVTDDVNLELSAGMKDTDAADDFGATIGQLIDTAKNLLPLVAGQRAEFKPLADEISKTLKSKVADKDVQITLKLTGDAIGKAAGAGD